MNNRQLKEKIPHGDAVFPLRVHEVATDQRRCERLPCHWHEELELFAVTEGCADFFIDGRQYRAAAGDTLFVNSDCLHSAVCAEGKPWSFFAVVFSPAMLGGSAADGIRQSYVDPVLRGEARFPSHVTPDGWGGRVRAALEDIRETYLAGGPAYELRIRAKLCEAWYLMYLHAERTADTASSDYRSSRIRAVLEYIQSGYDRRLTLAELSGAFGMSEGQFCRFFRSMTKTSVVDYVNSYRVRMSGALLRTTDRSIGEIACTVGFNNISYFNKMFRRYMHCSPSEYRRSHAGLAPALPETQFYA